MPKMVFCGDLLFKCGLLFRENAIFAVFTSPLRWLLAQKCDFLDFDFTLVIAIGPKWRFCMVPENSISQNRPLQDIHVPVNRYLAVIHLIKR